MHSDATSSKRRSTLFLNNTRPTWFENYFDACHVWQKLFELRWSGEPPQIMLKVNEALRGMWHEVALGETGSLVVQNIFENCIEEEKVCASLGHTSATRS